MTVTESQQDLQTDVDVALVPERAPRMILEICRGLTRFPQRPICGPRFFIGSGPGCDLRPGGESIPAFQSRIQTRDNGVWFEILAEEPPARLNGEVTRGEWLRDGDRIEIGVFQFVAHVLPELPPTSLGVPARAVQQSPEYLGELSADELADRLETEMGDVERFHRGRNAGAHALLQALKRDTTSGKVRRPLSAAWIQAKQPVAQPAVAKREPSKTEVAAVATEAEAEFRVDLDRLCRDLEELTQVLERRSETISHRELQFAKAAESRVEAQRELVAQLESALEAAARLRESHVEPKKPSIRVSA